MISTKDHNWRRTIFFALKAIAFILVACFVLEYPTQMLGKVSAAEKVYYISEVKTFQAKTEAEAIRLCENDGYTCAKKDLNAGTGKEAVVMGYKLTENKYEALYDIKLLHMDNGYQIKDYAEANEKLEKQNAGAAEAMYESANEFIANYEDGSPKAKEAYAGLNLFYIPEENNIGLGDYILKDKANAAFFAKVISRASSGAVTAITNFLSAGLTPLEKEKDNKTGKETDVSWADKVKDSALWGVLESKSITKDELDEYDKDMGDDAKALFKQLQTFATDFENSQPSYDEEKCIAEAKNANMDDVVENAEKPSEEDRAMTYVSAYEFLNEHEAFDGMPLGEFLVDIGKKTSEEVDLRKLYPVLEPMTSAQRKMVGMAGLMSIISNLGENKQNKDVNNIINRAKTKLREMTGKESFSIWVKTNPEMADKKVAFTDDAIRLNSARQILNQKSDVEKWEGAKETIDTVLKWINIGSGVITVLSFLAGKFGIPLVITAIKSATAIVSGTVTAIAAKSVAFSMLVGKWMGIFSLVLIAVSFIFLIVSLIVDRILKNKPKAYTEMADFAVDVRKVGGKDVSVTYKAVRDNQNRIADLNGYKAQNGWVCMYTTDNPKAGSPIRADEKGNVFRINYGDANTSNGYDCVSFFGYVTPGNCNTGAKSDDVNGIYINFLTEDSIANRSSDDNSGNVPQAGGTKKYYTDMIICSGKDPDAVKAKIRKRTGFTVLDQNLTDNVRKKEKTLDENLFTFIGYKTTGDPDQAIRDIRVAPFTSGKSLKFGQISYACAGTLGYPADKKDEDSKYPDDLDGLYFTKYENAGTPIEVGKLHLVDSLSKAQAGWEPVTTFSGLLYNFATTRFVIEDLKDPGRLRTYSCNYTGYITREDSTWNNPKRFLYYEPEVKYTSGTKYLSGVYFGFGADSERSVGFYGATTAKVSELFDTLSGLPNSGEPSASKGVNLAQSYFYKGFQVDSNQKYLRLFYTWSYNPYRALTDVQAFRGVPYTSQLPCTIEKALPDADKGDSSAEKTASYAAASVAVQRSMDGTMIIRAISSENAYMAPNGLLGANTQVSEGFTREAQGKFKFADGKMPLLPTDLYVSGYVKNRPRLTLDDVIVSTSAHRGVNNNSKLTCDVSGETTLGGNKVDPKEEFFSIQDLKDPHNLTPFNISYPSWTDDDGSPDKTDEKNGSHYHNAGTSVYMYIKHPVIRKKYISKIFVGACTRKDYQKPDKTEPSKDELRKFDRQVDLNAMVSSVGAGSDEMIPYNVAGVQTKAWYNYVKAGDDPEPDKEGNPAAYVSVTRTDDPDKAVKSVLLYKSSAKSVPDQIQIDGAIYYCASYDSPIKMNDDNTYFLYYSYNQGTTPGRPITELDISDTVFISGYATALVADTVDVNGKNDKGKFDIITRSKPYGNANLDVFIHAKYEVTTAYFNKLFLASGDSAKKAQLNLLEQGCTEFCDIDLNRSAGGKYIYLGYRGLSLNEDAIDKKTTPSAKEAEKQSQLYEAVYDIVCTVGEEFHPEGIITDRHQIYYAPVARTDRNKNLVGTDLNEGTTGPKIYMYYTTTYAAENYNEKMRSEKRPVYSTMPKDYMKSPLTKIAFALHDYVPYSEEIAAASTGGDDLKPWEYVMKSNNKEHLDFNEGAISFDSKHMTSDNRVTMFVQREDGSVKTSAEITGGYKSALVTENKLYLEL